MARTVLDDIVSGLRLRTAQVLRAEVLGPRFRRIVLGGPGLCDAAFEPGDKLQLLTQGFRLRTYTPMRWDGAAGETELIAFLHGDGPGARWARGACAGQGAQLFGPRRSLTLGPGRFVLVGDETSVGLALASGPGRRVVLEVSDAAEVAAVLAQLGVTATLIERRPDAAHLEALARAVADAVADPLGPGSALVLSGQAQTLSALRRALKGAGKLPRIVRTKAYWAPGKTGLD